jgi:hemerythrin-like metal-binding protein
MESLADILTWRPAYELGIAEIDAQHRALLVVAHELHTHLSLGTRDTAFMQKHIDDMLSLKAEHFATEERRFAEYAYEDAEEHVKLHQGFSLHVEALRTECGDDVALFAQKFVDFLAHWFVGHLGAVDSKYVPCFRSHAG